MTKKARVQIDPPIDEVFCVTCGMIKEGCICATKKRHRKDCAFRRAAEMPVELACEHGFQACPKCDACDCGAGEKKGIQ